MAQRPIIAGLDAGNSTSTLVLGSRRDPRIHTMPFSINSGHQANLERLGSGSSRAGQLEGDEYVFTTDSGSFFVGRLAMEQGDQATSGRDDVTRSWSGHTLRLFLVQASTLIAQRKAIFQAGA